MRNHAQSSSNTTLRHRNNHLITQIPIVFELQRFSNFGHDLSLKIHHNPVKTPILKHQKFHFSKHDFTENKKYFSYEFCFVGTVGVVLGRVKF